MRRIIMCIVAVLAATLFASNGGVAKPKHGSGGSGHPPPGLTATGRLTWNFEALVNDVFGPRRHVCEGTDGNVSPAVCARPLSDELPYLRIFVRAARSSFRRTSAAPPDLGNVVPLRVGGRYVLCGSRKWLVRARPGLMCKSAL